MARYAPFPDEYKQVATPGAEARVLLYQKGTGLNGAVSVPVSAIGGGGGGGGGDAYLGHTQSFTGVNTFTQPIRLSNFAGIGGDLTGAQLRFGAAPGTPMLAASATRMQVAANAQFGWSSTSGNASGSGDMGIARDSSTRLFINAGGNPADVRANAFYTDVDTRMATGGTGVINLKNAANPPHVSISTLDLVVGTAMGIGWSTTADASFGIGLALIKDAFGNLEINNGTGAVLLDVRARAASLGRTTPITASAPALLLQQTWNNAAVTFVGAQLNITKTAAAAASEMFQVNVGGTKKVSFGLDSTFGIGVVRAAMFAGNAADSTDLRIASAGAGFIFLSTESGQAVATLDVNGLLSLGTPGLIGGVRLKRTNADADAPAPADGATLYSKQVGGKNTLFVRFPTGAPIQLAIEP